MSRLLASSRDFTPSFLRGPLRLIHKDSAIVVAILLQSEMDQWSSSVQAVTTPDPLHDRWVGGTSVVARTCLQDEVGRPRLLEVGPLLHGRHDVLRQHLSIAAQS